MVYIDFHLLQGAVKSLPDKALDYIRLFNQANDFERPKNLPEKRICEELELCLLKSIKSKN